MEKFLRTATVVKVEPVGKGISNPDRLTLCCGDETHRAIFKSIDVTVNDVVRTDRFEACFRDCYRYEVAAYRLDRMLGIGLVPVTVVREINGEMGSVQEWIENVENLREALERPSPHRGGDMELLLKRLTCMYVLDSLIYNIDRNYDNILVNPADDRFFLIDHSRAFRSNRKVAAPQEGQGVVPLCPALAGNLRNLDQRALVDSLGDLLSTAQIRAVMKRRGNLVKVLERGGYLPEVTAVRSDSHQVSS